MNNEEVRKEVERNLIEKLGTMQLRLAYLETENSILRKENENLNSMLRQDNEKGEEVE